MKEIPYGNVITTLARIDSHTHTHTCKTPSLVYRYGNLNSSVDKQGYCFTRHSGDILIGQGGSGPLEDLERLYVDLENAPFNYDCLAFEGITLPLLCSKPTSTSHELVHRHAFLHVLVRPLTPSPSFAQGNIYTNGYTFGALDSCYFRLVNADTQQEILRCELSGSSLQNSSKDGLGAKRVVLLAKLFRGKDRWVLHSVVEGRDTQCASKVQMLHSASGLEGGETD